MLNGIFKRANSEWITKKIGVVVAGVFVVLICGYLLLSGDTAKQTDNITGIDTEKYAEYLETRLVSILSDVSGVGKCKVMVMLEESGTKVYATEEKIYNDTEDSGASESLQKETNYVLVGSSSDEYPIEITRLLPEISGIAVICSGGSSSIVKSEITALLSALTGLSSNNIHVSEMSK